MTHTFWQRRRLRGQDIVDQVGERGADKGRPAGSALVQHAPQRPQVGGCGVGGPVLEQLGGHVAGGTMLGLQARNTVIWEGAAPGCLEELGAQQALHGSAEQVTACSILQCHHSSIQRCRHYNRDLTLRSLLSLTGGIVCRGPQFCPASQRHGTSDLAIPEQNAALLASPLLVCCCCCSLAIAGVFPTAAAAAGDLAGIQETLWEAKEGIAIIAAL